MALQVPVALTMQDATGASSSNPFIFLAPSPGSISSRPCPVIFSISPLSLFSGSLLPAVGALIKMLSHFAPMTPSFPHCSQKLGLVFKSIHRQGSNDSHRHRGYVTLPATQWASGGLPSREFPLIYIIDIAHPLPITHELHPNEHSSLFKFLK